VFLRTRLARQGAQVFGFSSYKFRHRGVYPGETVTDLDWQHRLYRDKAPELLLYGRALGLSHSEAEDVLQETFLALLKLEARPENELHYCLRGFRNRALNHRRSLFRRVVREFESMRWFEREPEETGAERAAMRCLARLPLEQREVIVLKIWHDHTFEEIAEILEISPNTAAGRYRYGIEKLRACLQEHQYEEVELDREPAALMAAAASGPEN
jgi:RNA polymerase sigma-70 factor (ECF subfamily)